MSTKTQSTGRSGVERAASVEHVRLNLLHEGESFASALLTTTLELSVDWHGHPQVIARGRGFGGGAGGGQMMAK